MSEEINRIFAKITCYKSLVHSSVYFTAWMICYKLLCCKYLLCGDILWGTGRMEIELNKSET